MSQEENQKASTNTQQFTVQRIYLKDMSFETPAGVEIFKQQWKPSIQMDVNTRNEVIDQDIYEVVLTITITAKQGDDVGFLVEIQQAGIFICKGFDANDLRQALSAACPNILFPYARETIDSIVVKGSFPALMLAPMNFDALYHQAMQQAATKAQAKH